MINKGPAVLGPIMGMDRQTGPLVHQDDLVILIDDVQLRRRHGQVSIVLPGCIEKLVIDIELQNVADLQPVVPLAAASVALDALDADIFLGQGCRKKRYGLGKIPVQPLTGIVFFDGKLFHSGSRYPASCSMRMES